MIKRKPQKKKVIKKKSCRVCKTTFPPSSSTQVVCGIKCAINLQNKKKAAKEKREALIVAKLDRAEHTQRKFAIKSYTAKRKWLQATFNKLRRMQEFKWFKDRNIEPYCISCLQELGGDQWCNGHLKTQRARPDIALDPVNTYLQHNKRCNLELSGDIGGSEKTIFEIIDGEKVAVGREVDTVGYLEGLKFRFGEVKAQEIIDYCEKERPLPRYTDEEFKALGKQWNAEIRELEKELGIT